MATRYWVGGAGTWDASTTTHWSTNSGGAGGASAPTSADDVILDDNSGTGTVYATSAASCNNFTVTATQALTFNFQNGVNIYGSISLPVGGSVTFVDYGKSYFKATSTGNTIDLGNKTFGDMFFEGTGSWTLARAITSNTINHYSGTLNTANFACTLYGLKSIGSTTRTLNLGSSTINLMWNGTCLDISGTNLTFNSGTSTINFNNTGNGFSQSANFGGNTYYNVTAVLYQQGSSFEITSGGAFNNFSISTSSGGVDGFYNITLDDNFTVNGTLTTNSNSYRRIKFCSNIVGTRRTITLANAPSLPWTAFQDITIAGAIAPWTAPFGLWNLGNNSGVTFNTSPAYWVGSSGNWHDGTHWSLTSGGTPAGAVPGPNNNVWFNNSSGSSINCNITSSPTAYCNVFDASASTNISSMYGPLTIRADMTLSSSGDYTGFYPTFATVDTARGLNFNGRTVRAMTFNGTGGWIFQSAVTTNDSGVDGIDLIQGSLNTNGYAVTLAGPFNSTGSATRSLTLGASTITAGNGWMISGTTNFTLNAGTSKLVFTNQFGATAQFGGLTYYDFQYSPASVSNTTGLYISSGGTFRNFTCSKTSPYAYGFTINLRDNLTVTGSLSLSGERGEVRVFLRSDTIDVKRTVSAGSVSLTDVDFYGIAATGAATWSGTRIGNATNNTNITFTAPKTVYWRYAYDAHWLTGGSYPTWSTTSGGTASSFATPLPQDTAVFTNSYPNANSNITINTPYVPTLDLSQRTIGMNLVDWTDQILLCGNFVTSSSVGTPATSATFVGSGKTLSGNGNFNFSSKISSLASLTASLTGTVSSIENNGVLNLGSNCSIFQLALGPSSVLNFGTYKITLMGNNTTTFQGNTTQTITGTPVIDIVPSYNSGANSPIQIRASNPTEANSISFNVKSTSYVSGVQIDGNVKNIDCTGSSQPLYLNSTIYGNLTLDSTTTLMGNTVTFASTSGTKTITTNGKVFNFPITFNGVGGTWQLQDNLTQGSGYTTTLANGTLNLNSKTFTCGTFTTGSGTKNVTFNGGTLLVTASGSAFNNANPSGFSTTAGTGLGKISMNGISSKTFVGGGSTYNCIVENASSPELIISGNNTFQTISNSVSPTTFNFTSGSTQNIANWNINGAAGNLVTIKSTSTTNHTLNYIGTGTVSTNYLNITRSTANPNMTWLALNSVNSGYNSKWYFNKFFSGSGLFFGSNF